MRRRGDVHEAARPKAGSTFEVQDSVSGGHHTLILHGELDIEPAEELEALLHRICVDGTRGIGLDLSKVTFMGSTGLRVVLLAKNLCEQHHCEFSIVPGPRNIQRLFELTGLLDVLGMPDPGSAAGG